MLNFRACIGVIAVSLSFVQASCPSPNPNPNPTPPPAVDAGPPAVFDASFNAFEAACTNLARLGCSEGLDPNCVTLTKYITDRRLIDINVSCLAASSSKIAVRQCGLGVLCK